MAVLLAVDIGNTEIAFGLFSQDQLVATWRFASSLARTVDEYALLLDAALARHGLASRQVADSIIATTSPQTLPVLQQACVLLFAHRPLVVGPGVKTRLKIRFEPPTELSGDRIANAVAAYHLYGGGPVIVVDFGTATVFDVVSAKGEYLGGAMAPGLTVSLEALVGKTARIPRVELVAPPAAVGRTVAQALQSGLVLGHVEMFEGMLRRIRQEVGNARVLATGDLAEQFAGLSDQLTQVVPSLSLHGLRLLKEFNS